MIDVYAAIGTFPDAAQLAKDLAAAVMAVEGVPNIPMFRKNTAAFVHDLPATALANVDGDSTYVRAQVLTNAGALDREKRIVVVRKLTELIAAAAGDPSLTERRAAGVHMCHDARMRVNSSGASCASRSRGSTRGYGR